MPPWGTNSWSWFIPAGLLQLSPFYDPPASTSFIDMIDLLHLITLRRHDGCRNRATSIGCFDVRHGQRVDTNPQDLKMCKTRIKNWNVSLQRPVSLQRQQHRLLRPYISPPRRLLETPQEDARQEEDSQACFWRKVRQLSYPVKHRLIIWNTENHEDSPFFKKIQVWVWCAAWRSSNQAVGRVGQK